MAKQHQKCLTSAQDSFDDLRKSAKILQQAYSIMGAQNV